MKFINEHVCFDAFPKLPNHVTRLLGQNGGLSYLSTLSRWLGRAHKSLLRALKSIPVTREQHTSDGSLACVDMQGQWFGKLMTNVYLSNLWNRTKIKFRAAFKIMRYTLRESLERGAFIFFYHRHFHFFFKNCDFFFLQSFTCLCMSVFFVYLNAEVSSAIHALNLILNGFCMECFDTCGDVFSFWGENAVVFSLLKFGSFLQSVQNFQHFFRSLRTSTVCPSLLVHRKTCR